MKKLFTAIVIGSSVVGCAQIGKNIQRNMTPSLDLAKQDCVEMGFQVNTPQYQNCVMVTTQNIRSVRAQWAAESDAAAARAAAAAEAARPRTITCSGTGSVRTCTSF